MFKKSFQLRLAALYAFLAACSAVSVTTDYDPSAPFRQYRTYTFVPFSEKVPLSPSTDAAFRDSLRANLAARNIAETDKDADLHVVRHISTKEKTVVYQSHDWPYRGLPYGYGYYGLWASAPVAYTDVSQYTEGTLILDFVDAKTQKLVFRGIATGTVSDPQTNAERVREAIKEIVKKFPNHVPQ